MKKNLRFISFFLVKMRLMIVKPFTLFLYLISCAIHFMEQTTLVWGIMIVQIVCEKQPTKTFLIKPIKKNLILEKPTLREEQIFS
jgi:hypothetical protein